ncbi:DUF1801 domain-containing protein [Bailinhaonella thermotolerans]|uniref:DUF1801 domain-containing protein n=1 Tax=Bailinhaonella thermotolerans TaxID=1070861 RepID=A0A3A4AUB2_9ACTN|nr:DUF1801 domain-containing protein [Bailinhaonella thermotolerans]RJL30904.1 DUF1801 domain-containing protein [Bailinhaonella thermotolerans]
MSGTSKAGEESRAEPSKEGFSEEERAAMKARARELKAGSRARRGSKKAADDGAAVLAAIAEMAPPDRALAERVHALVTTAAPELAPRLWYGQPAYAKAGKVVCFFRSGHLDKERYSTFGFGPEAALDDPIGLWPTAFALTTLTESAEATLRDLVRRAAG